jgi:hypothetical protein
MDASSLQKTNYTEFFQMLLHIEEHQMRNDIRMYDRDDQTMEAVGQNNKFLCLEVQKITILRPTAFF